MDPWMQLSLAAVLMFLLGVLVFYPLRGPKTWRILRHEQSEFGE